MPSSDDYEDLLVETERSLQEHRSVMAYAAETARAVSALVHGLAAEREVSPRASEAITGRLSAVVEALVQKLREG